MNRACLYPQNNWPRRVEKFSTFEKKKSSYPQNNLVEKECFPVVLSVTRQCLPAVSDIPVASAGNKRVFNLLYSFTGQPGS